MKVFDGVKRWATGGPFVILVFIVSTMVLIAGLWFFAEDTKSSYEGFKLIEQMGVRVASWDTTYFLLAITPQIGQVLFFYIYLSDTKMNKWALFVAIVWFVVDFYADFQYRSVAHGWKADVTTFLITFSIYTVGSELFISSGFGVALSTFPMALNAFNDLLGEIGGGSTPRPKNPHGGKKEKGKGNKAMPDFPKPKRVRKPR